MGGKSKNFRGAQWWQKYNRKPTEKNYIDPRPPWILSYAQVAGTYETT